MRGTQIEERLRFFNIASSDSGPVAAKFVETLQRSNEQLVKLATLVQKKDLAAAQESLTDLDRENLFKMIKED